MELITPDRSKFREGCPYIGVYQVYPTRRGGSRAPIHCPYKLLVSLKPIKRFQAVGVGGGGSESSQGSFIDHLYKRKLRGETERTESVRTESLLPWEIITKECREKMMLTVRP